MDTHHLDVLGFTEHHMRKAQTVHIRGYTFFTGVGGTHGGVGFAVRTHAILSKPALRVLRVRLQCSRVGMLDVSHNGVKVSFVVGYAPPEAHSLQEKQDFWNVLIWKGLGDRDIQTHIS